jgi:hypothetical protein
VAQNLSVSIDSPVAGAPVGPVVYVSGTLSVVGAGPPFVHQVDQVSVKIGTGTVVTAQVTGPANPSSFPRSFSCVAPLPAGATGGQDVVVSVTGSTRAV